MLIFHNIYKTTISIVFSCWRSLRLDTFAAAEEHFAFVLKVLMNLLESILEAEGFLLAHTPPIPCYPKWNNYYMRFVQSIYFSRTLFISQFTWKSHTRGGRSAAPSRVHSPVLMPSEIHNNNNNSPADNNIGIAKKQRRKHWYIIDSFYGISLTNSLKSSHNLHYRWIFNFLSINKQLINILIKNLFSSARLLIRVNSTSICYARARITQDSSGWLFWEVATWERTAMLCCCDSIKISYPEKLYVSKVSQRRRWSWSVCTDLLAEFNRRRWPSLGITFN